MTETRESAALNMRFAIDSSKGVITGYASTFGGPPDTYGDVVAKGAFSASIKAQQRRGAMPPMLWSHEQDKPVGRWTSIAEDDLGLKVSGQINLQTSIGRDAFAHLKAGDLNGLSIGFIIPSGGADYPGKGVRRLLKSIDLVEISLVALPANDRARINEVRSIATRRELEEILHTKAGLSRAAAAKVAAGGFGALAGGASPDVKTLAERIRAAAYDLKG